MKISELIRKLREFMMEHGDMPVMGRGFDEGDYDNITGIDNEPMTVVRCSCKIHEDDNGVAHHGMYMSPDKNDERTKITACFVDANYREEIKSPTIILGGQ